MPVVSLGMGNGKPPEAESNPWGRSPRSLLVIPFGLGGEVQGFLYCDRRVHEGRSPFSRPEVGLAATVARELAIAVALAEREELRDDNRRLRAQLDGKNTFSAIVTRDPAMLEVLGTVRKVADSSLPVLLEGDTGTGKELVARGIHFASKRSDFRFIAVNCAALPDALLESELFGHRRGAFTGAMRDKKGLLEVADKGTFFLDEIADMGPAIQVKLLRVLEDGEVKRLGETESRKVDVRIVSATNKDLRREVAEGRFREDLYYRLNGMRIRIPPLRHRRDDIPLLVTTYVRRYGEEEGKLIRGVSREALRLLVNHDWPGNVRELVNELRRAITLAEEGSWITPELLSEKVRLAGLGVREPGSGGNGRRAQGSEGAFEVGDGSLPELLSSYEKQKIYWALREAGGVKVKAAERLGIHEATLRGKIKRYGLDRVPLR